MIFIFLASVVFLSILMASMNHTFSIVKEKSEEEYRYVLIAHRWMYDQYPLEPPAPINLIVIVITWIYKVAYK